MINVVITDEGSWWRRKKKIYRLSHPNKWGEVSRKQMQAIGRIMTGEISEERLLAVFLSCSRRVVRKLDEFSRYKLGDLMTFLGDKQPLDYFVIDTLKGHKAPGDKLRDLSFSEFMYIDTFFLDFSASENDQDILRKLIAFLFRKHVKGERPEFAGKTETQWTQKLKPWQMQISAFNYGLVRVWLEKAFPAVFATKNEVGQGSMSSKSGNGWIDVFDSIVGDDLVHSDDYASKPAMEVLRFLNKRIIESRKQRAKRKR